MIFNLSQRDRSLEVQMKRVQYSKNFEKAEMSTELTHDRTTRKRTKTSVQGRAALTERTANDSIEYLDKRDISMQYDTATIKLLCHADLSPTSCCRFQISSASTPLFPHGRDISRVTDEVNDVLAASADLERNPHPKVCYLGKGRHVPYVQWKQKVIFVFTNEEHRPPFLSFLRHQAITARGQRWTPSKP